MGQSYPASEARKRKIDAFMSQLVCEALELRDLSVFISREPVVAGVGSLLISLGPDSLKQGARISMASNTACRCVVEKKLTHCEGRTYTITV